MREQETKKNRTYFDNRQDFNSEHAIVDGAAQDLRGATIPLLNKTKVLARGVDATGHSDGKMRNFETAAKNIDTFTKKLLEDEKAADKSFNAAIDNDGFVVSEDARKAAVTSESSAISDIEKAKAYTNTWYIENADNKNITRLDKGILDVLKPDAFNVIDISKELDNLQQQEREKMQIIKDAPKEEQKEPHVFAKRSVGAQGNGIACKRPDGTYCDSVSEAEKYYDSDEYPYIYDTLSHGKNVVKETIKGVRLDKDVIDGVKE